MKKRNATVSALLPVVITLSIYVVFYSRIQCEPNHAGFWIILALGASIGVALTSILRRTSNKK